MSLQLAGVSDVRRGDEDLQEWQDSESQKFAHAIIDNDVASVLKGLALPLWNIATTFAIGAPPEQLVWNIVQHV
jgi:hypothetical protein